MDHESPSGQTPVAFSDLGQETTQAFYADRRRPTQRLKLTHYAGSFNLHLGICTAKSGEKAKSAVELDYTSALELAYQLQQLVPELQAAQAAYDARQAEDTAA